MLTMLHFLEPEFNSGHLISEYQLGDYGFLMSLIQGLNAVGVSDVSLEVAQ
jgi:hypothetical protein